VGKVPNNHIEAATTSGLAFVIRVYAVESPANTIRPLKACAEQIQATPRRVCEALALEIRKVKDYVVNSTPGSSYRGGGSVVAGQPFHSDAVIHQVNLEWRGGHRRGVVAAECIWTISFAFRHPYRKRVMN
jgi:hypothetical protein